MTDSDSRDPPSAGDSPSAPFELGGQQNALYFSLASKDAQLARMYLGSLIVFGDGRNPDALALAAHGIRELLEKLPAYFEVPMPAHQERLGNRVRELVDAWSRCQRSKCNSSGVWQGDIDAPLRKFLRRSGDFFVWFQAHMPRRRAEVSRALHRLDPSGRGVPPPLDALNVQRWETIREFFVNVAHHRHVASREEFREWLAHLERFLLERLRPRTFAELDKLDDLIRAGEGRDKS